MGKETEPLELTIAKLTGALAGAFIGALLLTGITQLLDTRFRPDIVDGTDSYGFIWFLTIPSGILLGAATAIALAYRSYRRYGTAGSVCIAAATLCLSAILAFYGFLSKDVDTALNALKDAMLSGSFVTGISIAWSVALLVWGAALQNKASAE